MMAIWRVLNKQIVFPDRLLVFQNVAAIAVSDTRSPLNCGGSQLASLN